MSLALVEQDARVVHVDFERRCRKSDRVEPARLLIVNPNHPSLLPPDPETAA